MKSAGRLKELASQIADTLGLDPWSGEVTDFAQWIMYRPEFNTNRIHDTDWMRSKYKHWKRTYRWGSVVRRVMVGAGLVKSANNVRRLYRLRGWFGSDKNVTVEVIIIVPGVGPTGEILYHIERAAKEVAESNKAVWDALRGHPEVIALKGWDQYVSAENEVVKVSQMVTFKKDRDLSEDLFNLVQAALGARTMSYSGW